MLGKALTTAAAGNAAGEGLYVEEIFSTYLYTGNGSTQTITNDIDLDGEGGLVWAKHRTVGYEHMLTDTARGTSGGYLQSDNTSAETDGGASPALTAFNSNGFTLGSRNEINGSGDFASWTFRKAPKFFDVVTYTGTGVAGRTVSHNLGSVPGCIIIKKTNVAKDWAVYHRGKGKAFYGLLNTTGAFVDDAGDGRWHDTDPTATEFTLGNDSEVNANNDTYVAYLFAHNDGDGEFGESGDQDIIKCGSIDLNSGSDTEINLGFEPQWLMYKPSSTSGNWVMLDNMRGGTADSTDNYLAANASSAEANANVGIKFTSTGFIKTNEGVNIDYIYIAIRRGPMKTPESGTEVFAPVTYTATDTNGRLISSGFPVDSAIIDPRNGYSTPGGPNWFSRLTGNGRFLTTAATTAELDGSSNSNGIMGQDGITVSRTGTNVWSNVGSNPYVAWFLRRAPGFFDVVAYEGTSASLTLDHNLGVAPELVIMRRRDATANWAVSLPGHTQYAYLNLTNAAGNGSLVTSTSSTQMTIIGDSDFNISGSDAIAYLFASVPGVSKVGSYTGTSALQTIDCGFSSGARFVLLKETNGTSSWIVLDSERGINAGNDPILALNNTNAEYSGDDWIDPVSSGFSLPGAVFNGTGEEYIFLAIA